MILKDVVAIKDWNARCQKLAGTLIDAIGADLINLALGLEILRFRRRMTWASLSGLVPIFKPQANLKVTLHI